MRVIVAVMACCTFLRPANSFDPCDERGSSPPSVAQALTLGAELRSHTSLAHPWEEANATVTKTDLAGFPRMLRLLTFSGTQNDVSADGALQAFLRRVECQLRAKAVSLSHKRDSFEGTFPSFGAKMSRFLTRSALRI